MNDTIICPNCKKSIPLTSALTHQLHEKYQKHFARRLAEEKEKLKNQLIHELERKIKDDMEFKLKDKINEITELREQNHNLQKQLLDLNRLIRQLKDENQRKSLELEKKLLAEEEKIRLEERRRFEQEYQLKLLEKDKKLQDALKLVEEYQRKLEQGSQQLQGEVLEIHFEQRLKSDFPNDEIRPIPKGVAGADIIQIVRNDYGKICGSIVWELKRTKNWNETWVSKLKEDQRNVKAEIAVLVSNKLPDDFESLGIKNGVWVVNFHIAPSLALVLRNSLIEINSLKSSLIGRQDKKEILWNYLTSIEFRQRVEAVYEAYSSLMNDLQKEKDFFRKKWSKQEKNIQQVAENILGIHGDLQAIVGRALPEIEPLKKLIAPANNNSLSDKESLF